MKKMLFVSFALMLTASAFAKQSWPVEGCSQNLVDINYCEEYLENDDGWILVGEVELSGRNTLTANLYIREVAQRIVYRIEFGRKFYAVRKKLPNDNKDYDYLVTINRETYLFQVQ